MCQSTADCWSYRTAWLHVMHIPFLINHKSLQNRTQYLSDWLHVNMEGLSSKWSMRDIITLANYMLLTSSQLAHVCEWTTDMIERKDNWPVQFHFEAAVSVQCTIWCSSVDANTSKNDCTGTDWGQTPVATTNLKAPVQTASFTAHSPQKTSSSSQPCLSTVATNVVTSKQQPIHQSWRNQPRTRNYFGISYCCKHTNYWQ